jgi:hypothetical protein
MDLFFKKVLYLGAWDHIELITYIPNCREFIFIDTQPRCEWDDEGIYNEKFYKKEFIPNLKKKLNKYGFKLINIYSLNNQSIENDLYINPHRFDFINSQTKTLLKYYISTNILYNMCDMLKEDIYQADALYNAGHHPDKYLLELFNNKKKTFIGDTNTVYNIDYNDNNIISCFLKKELNIFDYFDKFYFIKRHHSNNKFIKYFSKDNII